VSAADFSADGSALAMAGPSAIQILRTTDGGSLGQVAAPAASVIAVSDDGSLVAYAHDARISVRHAATDDPAADVAADAEPTALALSQTQLAAGAADGSIAVWSLDEQRVAGFSGAGGQVTAIGLDPRSGRIGVGFSGGDIATWRLKDGRLLYRRLGHRNGTPVTSVAFSPDGSSLVTAGGDSTARVWTAATGRLLYTLRGHTGTVHSAAFSPNGDWLVTAAGATVALWDSTTQQRLLLFDRDVGRILAASFDETSRGILVAGSDGALTRFSCEVVCGGVTDLLALADRRIAATGRALTATERRHYLGGD
jgi:WD40 repeat protein